MVGVRLATAVLAVGAVLVAARPAAVLAATAAEQDRAPTIDRVSINADGTGVFGGFGTPNARIALSLAGRAIGETIADADGGWQLELPRALAAGEHRIRAVAHADNAAEPRVGATVRISIPNAFGLPSAAQGSAADTTGQDLLRRASELADRASRGFDELLPELTGTANPGMNLVAIQKTEVTTEADGSMADAFIQWLASVLANAQEWLESSARDYQSVIVRRLSDAVAEPSGAPTAEKQSREPTFPPAASLPPSPPDAGAVRRAEAERLRQAEIERAVAGRRAAEEEARRKTEEAGRVKAEAEAKRRVADEARRQQQEAAKSEAEAKRRAAEEARRQQEAASAAAEAKRKAAAAEAQRLAAAEAARAETDAKRKAGEAAQVPKGAGEPQARTALADKPEPAELRPARPKAGPTAASLGKRAASGRTAKRDRSEVAGAAPPGSELWCNFFHYRYPMQLLDPGQWLAAAPLRR
jgi:hypothetical protein